MSRAGWLAGGVLLVAGGLASAEAPETSPRPQPRPATASAAAPDPVIEAIEDLVSGALEAPAPGTVSAASAFAPAASLRPLPRPAGGARAAEAAATAARVAEVSVPRNDRICGSRQISGETLAAIPGRVEGCGIEEPVRVRAVAGIPLSQPAIMDCTTARTLNAWVGQGVVPSVGRTGGGVTELLVAAHYACRPRNNQSGARISEHGRGRAIDITGVRLANGETITVEDDWRGRYGRLVKSWHRMACGPFGTVLGPGADRFHQDHLHLDTARYRSGSYCR